MYGGNPNMISELASDMWIERNIPGGLNSPLGEYLDNVMGGNPNPTIGQMLGGYPGVDGFGGAHAIGGGHVIGGGHGFEGSHAIRGGHGIGGGHGFEGSHAIGGGHGFGSGHGVESCHGIGGGHEIGGGHAFGGGHGFGGFGHRHESNHFTRFSHYGSTYGYSIQ